MPSAPAPPTASPAAREPATLPPHVLVLHNDEQNTLGYVVDVLRRVLGLSASRAWRLARVTHRRGRCAVWAGHRELAELKAVQVRAAGPDPGVVALGDPCRPLRVSVERAPSG
ncbi:ATP-dependent Clp protease adaptor ClpS [Phycisphaera mikurensis]|uniref:ATP-dependent Clp protease adapter protein ClpS n=1 Tax=Phycisphaera mikurensis (strain NBRC 102666 / KCTC 22515 / FYK2301M01) TaxID=1142394 RepID=I0IBH3_PHYMF|nr:ATP-dependent Clp protease adaptor ClpS [Phycisphaera mikurensis]MBB6442857.1 ATP-dependent Clp protease adapter protein ClpS [Phycisphaera mikurensis]BAM02611.1 ATP-dependent Clp protease adapter protein ClpS [Phycisphaera mikurensis NBRC 102666]